MEVGKGNYIYRLKSGKFIRSLKKNDKIIVKDDKFFLESLESMETVGKNELMRSFEIENVEAIEEIDGRRLNDREQTHVVKFLNTPQIYNLEKKCVKCNNNMKQGAIIRTSTKKYLRDLITGIVGYVYKKSEAFEDAGEVRYVLYCDCLGKENVLYMDCALNTFRIELKEG
jgi:hypothetical protein|tara:strand:+ start:14700 stop:15212 length:513 start_codon:yes stop_codon:yes gene_type:complete